MPTEPSPDTQAAIELALASKAPATTSVLRQLADTCDTERYIGLRDRAMLLLGFAALLRRSEVVALDVSDLVLVPEGLEVRVDHPVNRGERDPEPRIDIRAVPYGDHPETCPVRAWFAWRSAKIGRA